MTLASRILGSLLRLPPARTHDVTVERDLPATMADGAVLLADRWHPAAAGAGSPPPIVLLRSPYGRRQMGLLGRLFAERGYQAVIQSCRGTFGSGGAWEPFRHEEADGRGTLEWLAHRPWFGGTVATFGPSYLGLTQWSLLGEPTPALRAIAPSMTATNFHDAVVYPGGAFALETGLTWINLVEHQELSPLRVMKTRAGTSRLVQRAATVLPVGETDRRVVGHHVEFFQSWLAHDTPGDPWWDPVAFGAGVPAAPPATLLGGWYDPFLPAQLADFEALVAAGRTARLTIGPWPHASLAATVAAVRDGLDWFDVHLQGRESARREPVRLFVMGSRRWVDLRAWPPTATVERWHLHPGGRLAVDPPAPSPPDRYRYDPADPTPAAGGPSLDAKRNGRKDQRAREERADVLTYTSEPCPAHLTVMGPVTVELYLRSSRDATDFFVRLCDVSAKGRSTNLSDGIVRLRPGDAARGPDGTFRLRIALWPTANTFRPGHRIRLQVSSGAHPLVARNPGSNEPLATATTLLTAEQEVLHDPEHPSAVELPIRPAAVV